MCKQIDVSPNKTYKTKENAIKAFEKKFGDEDNLRYFVMQSEDGRYFPVCLFGDGKCLQIGAHFHFNVVG